MLSLLLFTIFPEATDTQPYIQSGISLAQSLKPIMGRRLPVLSSLLLLIPLLAVATHDSASDDPLIRQVVSSEEDGGLTGDLGLLDAELRFSKFKLQFGKTYATQEEHDYRLGVFKANLRRAALHQKLDLTAVHGITKFSDLTPEEFRSRFLGLKGLKLPADANKAPILPTDDLPADFDWRDHGAVTGVKDQVPYWSVLYIHFTSQSSISQENVLLGEGTSFFR